MYYVVKKPRSNSWSLPAVATLRLHTVKHDENYNKNVFIDASQKQDMLNLHLQFLTETTHLTVEVELQPAKVGLAKPI